MYIYKQDQNQIIETTGAREGLREIRDTCVILQHNNKCIFYEPVHKDDKASIGILLMHDMDYSTFAMASGLAERGFCTLAGSAGNGVSLDQQLLTVRNGVQFLKAMPGIEKVILMGHSGGATIMTAYQRAAENGIEDLQKDVLYPCTLDKDMILPKADGLMLVDANYGNGAMTLLSVDPAVKEEGNGMNLDPAYDTTAEANGYHEGNTRYTDTFKSSFYKAQAQRNNRIVEQALEALKKLENGEGPYKDDIPYPVTGGAQMGPLNKLIGFDLSLLSHTKRPHDLIHADGSVTHEIVNSVRRASFMIPDTGTYFACRDASLRNYLAGAAILAKDNFKVTEDDVIGIDWEHTYNCGPGNIRHIHCPSLFMGMTGGYEYLAAEIIYDLSPAEDKTIAFVEGATHMIRPVSEEYGDTEKNTFDYQADWLNKHFLCLSDQ